jgi:hypothetical protein
MKNIYLILCAAWLFPAYGTAQTKSVDVDNVGFIYTFRALPAYPQDPVHFGYATRIIAGKVAESKISLGALEDALYIEGQMREDNPDNAQMMLEITLGDIIVKSSDVRERKQEVKDKDGKVTGTNFFYSLEVNYSFESSSRILVGNEVLTKGNGFTRGGNIKYTSEEYRNRKGAADYWNNNKETLVAGFYQEHSLKTVRDVSSFASSRFGFPAMRNMRQVVKTIDEKKHNENAAFRDAVNALKELFQTMTPDEPADRAKAESLAGYFKSIPAKYADPSHKADVRLRYAAYFNLCIIYLLSDNPDKAIEYADLLVANGHDVKDGAQLKKDAVTLKESFEKTGIPTRHFDPETYFDSGDGDGE